MTAHDHTERVPGCFRCETGEDEVRRAAKHYPYLPPAVEFYCCGGCNGVTNDYVAWPCEYAHPATEEQG